MKYVIIVTDRDGRFDCILNWATYSSLETVKEVIKKSEEEDNERGWKYRYDWRPIREEN